MRLLVSAIVGIALAACGAKHVGHEAPGRMRLTSSAFNNGEGVPVRYTCDGASMAPELSWGEPPVGTKSFAIVVDDPDAPSGTFRHWGVFDIPAAARSIGGGQIIGTEAVNDFGKRGYGGPCPPKRRGLHHYHFKLLALDTDELKLPGVPKAADIERAASNHTLAEGELIGTYERK